MPKVERFAYLLALVLTSIGFFRWGQSWPKQGAKIEGFHATPTPAPEVRKAPGDVVLRVEPIPAEKSRTEIVRKLEIQAEQMIQGEPLKLEVIQFETPAGIRTEVKAQNGQILSGVDQPTIPIKNLEPDGHWIVQATRRFDREGWEWGAQVSYLRGPWVVSIGASEKGGTVALGVRF